MFLSNSSEACQRTSMWAARNRHCSASARCSRWGAFLKGHFPKAAPTNDKRVPISKAPPVTCTPGEWERKYGLKEKRTSEGQNIYIQITVLPFNRVTAGAAMCVESACRPCPAMSAWVSRGTPSGFSPSPRDRHTGSLECLNGPS